MRTNLIKQKKKNISSEFNNSFARFRVTDMLIEWSIERFITADKSEESTIKKISENQYSQESIFMYYESTKTLPTVSGLKIVSGLKTVSGNQIFISRLLYRYTRPRKNSTLSSSNNLFEFYHPSYASSFSLSSNFWFN